MSFLAELISAGCFGAVLLGWSALSAPAPADVPQCLVSDISPAEEAPRDACDCEEMRSTIDRQRSDNAHWEHEAMDLIDEITKLKAAASIPQQVEFCKRYDYRPHKSPSFCSRCGELSRKLAASERSCASLVKTNDILRS